MYLLSISVERPITRWRRWSRGSQCARWETCQYISNYNTIVPFSDEIRSTLIHPHLFKRFEINVYIVHYINSRDKVNTFVDSTVRCLTRIYASTFTLCTFQIIRLLLFESYLNSRILRAFATFKCKSQIASFHERLVRVNIWDFLLIVVFLVFSVFIQSLPSFFRHPRLCCSP